MTRCLAFAIISLCLLAACSGAAAPAASTATPTASALPQATARATATPPPVLTHAAAVATSTATPSGSVSNPLSLQLVGQFGGGSGAVASDGRYAYLNIGPRLAIVDIADPAHPVVAGRSSPLPGFEALSVTGGYAYVAAGPGGLRVLDVSDPAAPVEVFAQAFDSSAFGTAIAGSYLYLGAGDGLHIFDLTDPGAPQAAGFLATPDVVHDVAVAGSLAYIAESYSPGDLSADRGGLRVVDITDPLNPREVGFYPLNPGSVPVTEQQDAPQGAYGVAVLGDRAYVTYRAFKMGAVHIVNVSDPSHPVAAGEYRDYIFYVSRPSAVERAGRAFVYVGTGPNSGLLALDVSDPAHLAVLADDVPGMAEAVLPLDDRLLTADGNGGLHVASIADPAHPVEIGAYRTLGVARKVVVSGRRAYVVDGLHDLWTFDVTDPADPAPLGAYAVDGNIQALAVQGDIAYIAAETSGLLIVDLSDPSHPRRLAVYQPENLVYGVAVDGDYAYVGAHDFLVLSIATPEAPTAAGRFTSTAGIGPVVTAEDRVYYVTKALHVLSVEDPLHPREVAVYATSEHIGTLAVSGQRVYAGAGNNLLIIDIPHAEPPTRLGELTLPSQPGAIAIADGYAFVAGGGMLHAITVAAPEALQILASLDGLQDAVDIAVAGGYIYLANGDGGLVVVRFNPAPAE
jgi:hypothetical protein